MISCFSALPSSIASTFSNFARISAFRASSCCRMYRASSPFSRSTNVLIMHTVAGRAATAGVFAATTAAVARVTAGNRATNFRTLCMLDRTGPTVR